MTQSLPKHYIRNPAIVDYGFVPFKPVPKAAGSYEFVKGKLVEVRGE